jgi:membrane protein
VKIVVERAKRAWRWVSTGFAGARRRYGWLDHLTRAAIRYDEARGGRLAAAVTYNAFLATFPVLLIAYSVLGYLIGRNAAFTAEVSDFLEAYLPTLDVQRIAEARYTAGIIGVIGVVYAGLGWVDTLRASIRLMWRKEETPGNPVLARVIDLGVLVALGLVFGASIVISTLLNGWIGWGLERVGITSGALRAAIAVAAFLVGMLVNVGVFVALLAGLPRLRMSFSRLIAPAIIGGLGFELLTTFSRIILVRTAGNAAYALVASAVGLLIFMNLLNQLLLFCAAMTATSKSGEVRERRSLAARRAELRDDATRRAPVDAPTPGAVDGPTPGAVDPAKSVGQ